MGYFQIASRGQNNIDIKLQMKNLEWDAYIFCDIRFRMHIFRLLKFERKYETLCIVYLIPHRFKLFILGVIFVSNVKSQSYIHIEFAK